MITFNPTFPFSFNYPTASMESGLFIKATVYDITTGSPVAVTTVNMPEIEDGYYAANFAGASTKSYLIIALVYTDGTYSTIDLTYAPNAECYKATDADQTLFAFNYGVIDQDAGLFLGANIYDCTTGSPVFVEQVAMSYVFGGVYFGVYTGTLNHVYENIKFVYIDMGLTMIDTNWSPGSDAIQLFEGGAIIEQNFTFSQATLIGQSLGANLKGQSLSAILEGD